MVQWKVLVLLMFLVKGICVCRCLPSFLLHAAEHVETVYVTTEEHLPSLIVKRASNHLPRNLNFRFHFQSRPITLRLKRNDHGDRDLPVFTLKDGLPTRQRMEKDSNIGFYHDTDQGASFQVTAHHHLPSQPFHLEGTLFIDGKEYLLSPEHRLLSVNESDIAHALKRLTESLPFGQDVIDERGPYAQFSARQREFQRHMERSHHPWRNHNNSRVWRWKRQSQRKELDTHYIEVSMIADYAVWLRFMEYANNDEDKAFQELQLYYKYLATMMNVRYESVTKIDPNLAIRIRPVSLIVTNFRKEAIWTEPNRRGRNFVHAVNSLYALRNWVRRGIGVPEADHTMLFTGYDLQGSNGDSSTIGVAFIGTACTFNSVSLIEEYFTGTSGAVSAHELGHSLNAEHDGEYRRCSDVTSNVMSTNAVFPSRPSTISNPWIFSDCSVDAFGAFLDGVNCTKNEPKQVLPTVRKETTFGADEQCRLVMGQGSYFCRSVQARRGFSSMCRHLYCYLPHDPGYCGSVIAAEFTICGNGKWCSQGKCVRHPEAPIVQDTCPQGDEPGYQCTADRCREAKVKNIHCCQWCQADAATTKAPDDRGKLIIGTTSSTSLKSSSARPPTSNSTARTSAVTTLEPPLISSLKATTMSIFESSTDQVVVGPSSPRVTSSSSTQSSQAPESSSLIDNASPSSGPAQYSPSVLSTSSPPSSSTTKNRAVVTPSGIAQPQPTSSRPTTVTLKFDPDDTTKIASTPKPTPAYVPCASIQCLCQRCFYCYLNLCPLFSPGGLYYAPGR